MATSGRLRPASPEELQVTLTGYPKFTRHQKPALLYLPVGIHRRKSEYSLCRLHPGKLRSVSQAVDLPGTPNHGNLLVRALRNLP